MCDVTTERVRVPLTSPQAVAATSAVLWWPSPDPRSGPRSGPQVRGSPLPDPGRPAFVLAHGAGSDLTHPTLRSIGRGLARRGHVVATFNFAYAEAGRKRPDPMARLERAYRDVLAALQPRLDGRPVAIGGRSMGGRVASHLAAQGEPCAGLCLFGYPLHPAGRPERVRTDHWPALRLPVLFVTGDRDRLCDLAVLEQERAARLAGADDVLHVVADADHAFGVRARDGRTPAEVVTEVVDAAASWAARLTAGGRTA